MRTLIPLTLALVLAACSTPSSVAPLTIPLQYKLQANAGEIPAGPSCAAIADVRVTDARTEQAIGRRFVEGKSTPAAPVTTTSDVAAWARAGALDTLHRAGINNAKAGSPLLRITVDQISTSENVLHRSGYEGRISLTAELTSAAGTSCWKERAEGFSENYGYAGSTANYQETLNHALDRAMIHILSSTGFRKAVCACG